MQRDPQLLSFWQIRDILDCDALQTHPMREEGDMVETWGEVCTPEEAEYWQVSGRWKDSEAFVELADFKNEQDADIFVDGILKLFPHLKKIGVYPRACDAIPF